MELMAFFDSYMKEYENDDFERLCGVTYEEDIYECASNGGCVSIWVMAGLASVLQRPVISVYPTISGDEDPVSDILNRTLRPRLNYDESRSPIHILWSSLRPLAIGKMWTMNHFVPLVLVQICTTTDSTDFLNEVNYSSCQSFAICP